MVVISNHAKESLAAGKLVLGMSVRQSRTVDIASIAKNSGFDFLWIDMEHSSISLDTAIQLCLASIPWGITPLVRVQSKHGFHLSRVLDGGAMGVIVPHVDTADEARKITDACLFRPRGGRGVSGAAPQLGFKTLPFREMRQQLNDLTMIVVQIESPEAVENAEAIAAVPGIDVLLIGTNDLCAAMGIDGETDHPKVEAAYAHVISAARKHGKHVGTAGARNEAATRKFIEMGARLVNCGSDYTMIMKGAAQAVSSMRHISL